MSKNLTGNFSANLFALQLQLKSLFDDAGGEATVSLLDSLTKLSPAEQTVALKMFKKVAERIISGEIRVSTRRDELMKELEDTLYSDIVSSMEEAAKDEIPSPLARKLEVVDGGRSRRFGARNEPIDIKKARDARKVPIKPVLN